MNLNSVKSEKQILAESAGIDFLAQIGVGRGQDSDVGTASLRRADPLEFTGLQNAQELRLLSCSEVRDFVQKQGPVICQFETARTVRASISECALYVPEHLTFENTLGKPSHVHRD